MFSKIISQKTSICKTLKLTAIALSSTFAFSTAFAEVSYQQNFEKSGQFEFERYDNGRKGAWFWDTLKNSGNHPTIEQAPQRNGKAGKFYLSKNGSKTTLNKSGVEYTSRTEVSIDDKSEGDFELGKEYWINLDYRYERWEKEVEAKLGRDYMIGPLQVHTRPSKERPCTIKFPGGATGNAPFLMKAFGNKLRFLTFGGKTLWERDIKLKQWVNIVIHFKLSYNSDGFVEVWQDGIKLNKITGRNMCGENRRPGFFKMGLYNAAWEIPKNPDPFKNVEREIWIDNLKIGTGYPDSVGTPPKKDIKAPSTPSNLKASGVTTNSINLNWSASSDNIGVKEYEVHYNGKMKTATGTNTTLSGLAPNVNYSIRVRAFDATGNASNFSAPETAVTDAVPVVSSPPEISNINAQVSSTKTVVTWKTNVPAKAIVVFYAKDIAPKHQSVKTYITNGYLEIPKSHLVASKKYTYYVRVTDQKGTKTQSANFNFNTPKKSADPVPSYTVNYIATTGGTISGATTQTVNKGSSASTITAAANNGYTFIEWSDGQKTTSRTDTNIISNRTFRAIFSKKSSVPDDTDEPTNSEPAQDKSEDDSAAGSFPIGLLILGLLALLRRSNPNH